MFTKNNLYKASYIFSVLSIIVFIFGFFDIQWRGASIVNNIPNIDIAVLQPVKTIITNLVGNDYGQLICNIGYLNVIWYIFIVFPVWCWNFVKGVFN